MAEQLIWPLFSSSSSSTSMAASASDSPTVSASLFEHLLPLWRAFHFSEHAAHRDARTYTPAVVDDGSGELRMYYSAQLAGGGPKKIGLALLPEIEKRSKRHRRFRKRRLARKHEDKRSTGVRHSEERRGEDFP